MPRKSLTIALAGNPNSGKTTIFNALTGAHQHVGNWPGVTVEKKEGRFKFQNYDVTVVDLPGTYSLSAYSMEEVVARNYLIFDKPDVVIQVLDASNLERNLFLTTQLIELERPLVLAMNVYDSLVRSGVRLDLERLGVLLGAPAVPTVGIKGKGIHELVKKCIECVEKRGTAKGSARFAYGEAVETQIRRIQENAAFQSLVNGTYPPRWFAVKLLENDREIMGRITEIGNGSIQGIMPAAKSARESLSPDVGNDAETLMTEQRYHFISRVLEETCQLPGETSPSVSAKVDRILTHKVFGLPVFFLMIWAIFQATFRLGDYPMRAIEIGVGWFGALVRGVLGNGFVGDLVVNGAINGVGFVLVFLPNILILFFCISLIEDSGYMARVAFLMDRVMRAVGLHGKAFIPLLMGFGCNVPAVMATRTLDTHRDRLLTMLVNPLVSCSARLPVYILLAGAFFPPRAAGTVIFSLYALGIALAILMAKIFSRTILKGDASPFIMELPPYRLPTLKNSLTHMWERGKLFLRKMGGIILVGSLTIWVLTYFPRNPQLTRDYEAQISAIDARIEALGPDRLEGPTTEVRDRLQGQKETLDRQMASEKISGSLLGKLGNFVAPVFSPLGFDWQSTAAILTGFVAKEIVVSTYGEIYQAGGPKPEHTEGLRSVLRRSNLTPLTAYALMCFILIYTPCLGTMAAIRRETNSWKWTAFTVGYSLVLAWTVSFTIVHVGRLAGLG